MVFFICWLAKGRPWHTSPQTDTPLGLLRGMPRSSYCTLKWQKNTYKSISCHCVSTERYAMFALEYAAFLL